MFEERHVQDFLGNRVNCHGTGDSALYNLLMYCDFNFLKLLSCNQNLLIGNFASRSFSQNTASLSSPLKKMHLNCSLRISLIILI